MRQERLDKSHSERQSISQAIMKQPKALMSYPIAALDMYHAEDHNRYFFLNIDS